MLDTSSVLQSTLHISPLILLSPSCPCVNSQSKNRHLELRLYPQHCTRRPVALSRCLCIKLHVLFRQPKKLRSVQKLSSASPVGLSSISLGGAAGAWHEVSACQQSHGAILIFLSFKCTFPSLQGFGLWVGIQHIALPPPPPSFHFPLILSLVQQLVLHWFTGVDTSSVFEL